jgi:hypothetical protein
MSKLERLAASSVAGWWLRTRSNRACGNDPLHTNRVIAPVFAPPGSVRFGPTDTLAKDGHTQVTPTRRRSQRRRQPSARFRLMEQLAMKSLQIREPTPGLEPGTPSLRERWPLQSINRV